ncbi:EpsG family protein [Klebsiella pneumoniae]|uniref:EpsG family protein n=2 Tax=Klebsiella TaxID=570 RepID=A7M6Z9_KLEPN|nr:MULTISPECIES: EpsG family protein [Klebsiella]BAT24469.1 O-antigen and lipid-linked capsular repeat unit polymerase [Klebsiella sp. A1517]HBT4787273.1 EpsG family protein [Klebsiella variicola subsp. variicola]MEC4389494.1 EpsG family protein [Klebsiella pneumoniae]MEC4406712.1 EpsG family protein [Klebsiella pneumoniae]UAA35910.1 EpsG family protein [Klebsiella pneumoniae]
MPLFLTNITLFLYFLISLFLLLLSVVSIICKSKKLDFIVFLIIGIMMVCFYGLRFPGNSDTRMYLQGFDSLSSLDSFMWSSGFYVLMKSIKIINNSHDAYIFLSSLYFVLAFMLVGILYCKDRYYKSLFLLTCFYSWSVLDLAVNTYRQGIAIPFIILGVYFLNSKKNILAVVAISIALTIHWGSSVIVALYFIAIYLSKHLRLLKIVTFFTLMLFTLSFFINFEFAGSLSKSSLISSLQVLFVGVDLTSKIDAYLGGGVVGARFYDMPSLQRLYFSGEIYIAILIFSFFFLTRKAKDPIITSGNFVMIYSFFTIVAFYGVVLISMTWFIRNFYWAVPITPVLYVLILQYYEKENVKKHHFLLLLFVIFQIAFSIETFWRAPLIDLVYPY